MFAVRVVVFLAGLAIVVETLTSAIRTFVLPRGVPDRLTRGVFQATRRLFDVRTQRAHSYAERDRAMALYAPVSLLILPGVWLLLVAAGYACMFWALGPMGWGQVFRLSGSSLLTLGFTAPDTLPKTALAFSEAAIGLIQAALLIAYLPAMYAAWSRREEAVALLEVRAGSPPTAVEMLVRSHRIGQLRRLSEIWQAWEVWFANIEETHTSLAPLAYFRSPQPERSWVTAAGAILDGASLVLSAVEVPRDPQANLCIRAGYLALRRIAGFFGIQYDPDPRPDDPISIAREEFDDACNQLAAAGVPLKQDRDRAWRDFAGWRVNYDAVLLGLATLTMAPEAPWSSDRSLRRPPSGRRRLPWTRK